MGRQWIRDDSKPEAEPEPQPETTTLENDNHDAAKEDE